MYRSYYDGLEIHIISHYNLAFARRAHSASNTCMQDEQPWLDLEDCNTKTRGWLKTSMPFGAVEPLTVTWNRGREV